MPHVPDSAFLKAVVAELDVNLEEELARYQYWKTHGRAPTVATRSTPRSKKRPPVVNPPPVPEVPLATTPPPTAAPPMDPIGEAVTELMSPPSAPELESQGGEVWDWQGILSSIVLMLVVGTIGYIAAEMLNIDRWFSPSPTPTPTATPPVSTTVPDRSAPTPPPIGVKPTPPADNPISVLPPLPNTTNNDLPPVEASPPPGETIVSQDSPILVYKVIVDGQYLDRARAIDPGAYVRPSDGKVQVGAFQDLAEAKRLIESLVSQDIPAQLE